jgi:succinoglycan biosynthesis transport protein ExoP
MSPLIEVPDSFHLSRVPSFPETPAEPPGLSFSTLWSALRRHKALILITFVLTSMGIFGFLLVLPPRYTGSVTVAIEQSDTRALVSNPIANGLPEWMPGDNTAMLTQVDVLRTRALAIKVVDKLGLANDQAFRSLQERLKTRAITWLTGWMPVSWQEWLHPHPDVDPALVRQEVAVQHLLHNLTVKQLEGSHLIQVDVTASTAILATRIANALVEQYLDDQIAVKRRVTQRAHDWAAKQVQMQQQQLLAAETASVTYMIRHNLTALNGMAQPIEAPPSPTTLGGLPGQQLFKLQDELAEARAQLAAKLAKVAEVVAIQANKASFASLPEVQNSPIILELEKRDTVLRGQQAQLASTYSTKTGVLERIWADRAALAERISQEINSIVRNIRDEATMARERVAELERTMASSRQHYNESELHSVELRELTRDVAAKRGIYDRLLVQMNEISQQIALAQPDARVISAAMPPLRPDFPNKTVYGGIGMLGALALGVTLAAFAEQNDRTLRTGPQVERTLGVNNLAVVPRVKPHQRRGATLHHFLLQHPQSVYAEAIRSILMQLMLCSSHPQVVLVTSALPHEGKTTTALSLGMAAARFGRRTVVVDLDLRNPGVAEAAEVRVQAGLAEYMAGEADLNSVVQVDRMETKLHFLPLRDWLYGSANVLHAWDLRGLIATLRLDYDCIFLSVPPSLAITDIQPIASLVDVTLYLVRWGKTSSAAALNGMIALSRIGLSITGVALTQVNLKRHALYGYEQSGEYHERYLQYFQH